MVKESVLHTNSMRTVLFSMNCPISGEKMKYLSKMVGVKIVNFSGLLNASERQSDVFTLKKNFAARKPYAKSSFLHKDFQLWERKWHLRRKWSM